MSGMRCCIAGVALLLVTGWLLSLVWAEQSQGPFSTSFSTRDDLGVLSPYVYGELLAPGAPLPPGTPPKQAPSFVEIPWRDAADSKGAAMALAYLQAGSQVCLSLGDAGPAGQAKAIEAARSLPEVGFFSIGGLSPRAAHALAAAILKANPGTATFVSIGPEVTAEALRQAWTSGSPLVGVALPWGEWGRERIVRFQTALAGLWSERSPPQVLVSGIRPPPAAGAAGLLSELFASWGRPTIAASADLGGSAYADEARRTLVLLAREAQCHGRLMALDRHAKVTVLAAGGPFRVALCVVNGGEEEVAWRGRLTAALGRWSQRTWPLPAQELTVAEWRPALGSDGTAPMSLSASLKRREGRVVVLQNDLPWTYREMRSLMVLLEQNLRGDRIGLQSLRLARESLQQAILERGRVSQAHEAALVHRTLAGLDEAALFIGRRGSGALGELSVDMAAETERALATFQSALSTASADLLGLRLSCGSEAVSGGRKLSVSLTNGAVAGLENVAVGVAVPVGWRVRAQGATSKKVLPPGAALGADFILEPPAGVESGVAVVRVEYRLKSGRALLTRSVALTGVGWR